MVDDHSRLACSEILPDEKGPTCAAVLVRAAHYFADYGITTVQQTINDDHLNCRRSRDFAAAATGLGPEHLFIRPRGPVRNGKVERYNRTLQTEGPTSGCSPEQPTRTARCYELGHSRL